MLYFSPPTSNFLSNKDASCNQNQLYTLLLLSFGHHQGLGHDLEVTAKSSFNYCFTTKADYLRQDLSPLNNKLCLSLRRRPDSEGFI